MGSIQKLSIRCCCLWKGSYNNGWMPSARHLIISSQKKNWIFILNKYLFSVPIICNIYGFSLDILKVQRRFTAKALEIQKKCKFALKFSKLYFLSEQFFRISFSYRDIGNLLKKCTFFPRLRLENNRFWRGLLVCSLGSRNKRVYQN